MTNSHALDHFSGVASHYSLFRPKYSPQLLDWLAAVAPDTELAWDCACGSGQATVGLASRFRRVIATDISRAQIEAAVRLHNIDYRIEPAESPSLTARQVDLITVAQALHWLRLDEFYEQVARALKPRGVLAVWSYGVLSIEQEEIQKRIAEFYHRTVGPYWPSGRQQVEEGYRSLPFPFPEITPPTFSMQAEWALAQLLGYVRSWSATSRYITAEGRDPVKPLQDMLASVWGDPTRRVRITWPLIVRAGLSRG